MNSGFRLLLCVFSCCVFGSAFGAEVTSLKCEYAVNPIAIQTSTPRLFWIMESDVRGERQTAFQILAASSAAKLRPGKADLWDSGKMTSPESIQMPYDGKKPSSRQRVYWTVRVWDRNGKVSRFAEPAWFETGLLNQEDWQATWISAREVPSAELFSDDPSPMFRKEFAVERGLTKAHLYVSGLGYYEMWLNGRRVSDHVLDPGWTEYSKRVFYSVFDVKTLLSPGANAIGSILGNGWYNPLPLKFWGKINVRENLTIGEPMLIAQLHLTYSDGSEETVCTDPTWRTAPGPILRNNLYLGEKYDARKEMPGWNEKGFDDSRWAQAITAKTQLGQLQAQEVPPIRVTRILKAQSVTEPRPGVFIFDLGQNFAGWARLKVKGPAGTTIRMRFGELLYPDGTLNAMTTVCGQIKAGGKDYEYEGEGYPKTAWQQDVYILKGDPAGEEWTPKFTFHGFRYVEVKGFPGKPGPDAITGLRLNTDVQAAGEFECSNDTINRIQQMVLWTELSNLFSVQSDCPHREKFGYGGDIVASSEMGLLNFDMAQFYAKALRDLGDSVRPNGGFTETAPFVGISDESLGEKSGPIGWGTAHPVLQAQLLQYYGDRRLIAEQQTNTVRWLDLLHSKAVDGILDNGISDHESIAPKPRALTGTGFYYFNCRLFELLQRTLGNEQAAVDAARAAASVSNAFNVKFLDNDSGRYGTGSQASQAFPLYLGLVPEQSRQKALEVLIKDIIDGNKGHLTTGIFGTKYMLNALTDAGRTDVAWQLVTQKAFPGWGYMLENGATTLWEHWAFSDNTYSHNHPMFGSVSEWFYKALAGIQPAADAVGFDRIQIRPPHLPELGWVRAHYDSIRGRVRSNWRRSGDEYTLDITIPVGAAADVWLPATNVQSVTEGGKPLAKARGITQIRLDNGHTRFDCASGQYRCRWKAEK